MIDKELLYDAVICKEEDSILEASRIMRDTKARHLIIVNKHLTPIGIISPFDITNRVVSEGKDPQKITAAQIMTKPVETIDLHSDYKVAAEKMALLEAFTMPVTDKGKIVGMLDYSTVFRHICEVKKND